MNECKWLGLSRESDAPTNPVRVSESVDTVTCYNKPVIYGRSWNASSVRYLRYGLFGGHDSWTDEMDNCESCGAPGCVVVG